jgi:hypothetical protein
MVIAPLEDPPPDEPASGGAAAQGTGGTGAQGTGGSSEGGAGDGGAGDAGNTGGTSGAATGGTAGSAGTGGATGECTTNAECVERALGEPYRCRPSDHTCVPLKTSECPLAYGDAADPNAIFFGAFATLNPNQPDVSTVVWSHRLALDELSGDAVGGLPGGPDDARRPLVMVVCNNHADYVEESVRHLAEDLEVPAMLATLLPGDFRRAFETYRDREIFFLGPVAASRTLVELDDDDLIWNLLGQPSDLAPAYNELLGLVEDYIRATRSEVATRGFVKVALVTTTDAYNLELNSYVEPALRFNGTTAMANRATDRYLSLSLDSENPVIDDVVLDLLEFEPDIVISVAGEQFTRPSGIAETIDLQWGTSTMARPYFILSPFNAGNLSALWDFIEVEAWGDTRTDPLAYRRYVGVSVAGAEDPTLQNQYATRLLTRFGSASPDTGNYYDAVYFLAYAIYAAGNVDPLTGADIARGMRRLLDGQALGVGPMEISDVFSALEDTDSTIELYGTLGPPDFNPDTGTKYAVGSVFCFAEASEEAVLHVDVLRYDRELGNFGADEVFPCYSGFYP